MLLKLLKYDFKKALKRFLVMLIIIGGTTGIGCMFLALYNSFLNRQTEAGAGMDSLILLNVLMVLLVELLYIAPFVCMVIYMITMYKYFFDDVLGSRSYLTHTLPVTTTQILFSKLLSSSACVFGLMLAAVGSIVLTSMVSAASQDDLRSLITNGFKELLRSVANNLPVADLITSAILIPLYMILLSFFGFILFYFFMILGYCTAKRHKVGAGIGFFLGGSYLLGIVVTFIHYFVLIGTANGDFTNNTLQLSLFILPSFILISILAVVMWLISDLLLKKKLDLL